MVHTILKFLKCKWPISQNIAHFQLAKNPKFLEIGTRNCRCQNEGKLSVFRKFLSILHLDGMSYIAYIKKIFDWSKNE